MRETGLRGKTCVVPVAIAAGLGMAGMGLVSSGAVAATDVTSMTDTLNVEVLLSCTFNSVTNKTYVGSADNGTEVENFNDGGVHEFSLFCNGSNGYTVTATPHDLEATGIANVISYTDNYTPSGTSGLWTAAITSDASGVTVIPVVPVGGGTIISSDSGTEAAGISFTATYSAYVGTATPAGTYTGTIVYTLTASEASNGGGSGSGGTGDNGNGGDSGTDSGNGATGNNGGSSGDSGSGGTGGSGSGDANSNNGGSGDTNNTPSNVPVALNNTYNTYNTYSTTNTYNTTNYSGGGASVPAVTSGSTNDATNGAASGDNDSSSSSGANDDYEQPLGVTTNTSSTSSKSSGVDPMPLIVAGVLAVAGTAGAVALARSNQEE